MKQLVFRADDLGYTHGINQGIMETIQAGTIHNVGVMVNMPWAPEGIRQILALQKEGHEVDLGLHVNISNGSPILPASQIPTLTDQGIFRSSACYRQALQQGEDPISLEEGYLEAKAQIQAFEKLAGKLPAYVDFHAVFSPSLQQGVKQAAREYGLPFIGLPFDETPIFINDHPVEVTINRQETIPEILADLEEMLQKNSEEEGFVLVIFHPGYVDDQLRSASSLTTRREVETAFLSSPELQAFLQQHDLQLHPYHQIFW